MFKGVMARSVSYRVEATATTTNQGSTMVKVVWAGASGVAVPPPVWQPVAPGASVPIAAGTTPAGSAMLTILVNVPDTGPASTDIVVHENGARRDQGAFTRDDRWTYST